jgi:LysM repeat protein
VQPGDTLDTIAAELGLDVGALWWSNRALLQSGPLAPGMQLMVPNIHGFLYQVQSGDTWDSIATTFGLPTLLVQQLNQPSRSDQPRPGELVFIPRPTQ